MKHAGSRDNLLGPFPTQEERRPILPTKVSGQSLVSRVVCLACGLLLVAIVADAPVRALARSLDPSVISALRLVTEFGNSAWSLGIGLILLVCIAFLMRGSEAIPAARLQGARSVLLLLVGSVAISGALASLAKNVIGRIRPSMGPDAQVLDFAILTFRAGWASFPSGHATTATACALALAIAGPRLSWAWLSIGLVAALSRAFLGVHWLSDCLAGMALGATVTLALRSRMVARGHVFEGDASVLLQVLLATAGQVLWATRTVGGRAMKRIRRHASARSGGG